VSDDLLLPPGFDSLKPFVSEWTIRTSADRASYRDRSNFEELRRFYDAASPRLAEALEYLDVKPLSAHNEQDKRLMSLMLTLAHVSLAQELQVEAEGTHALSRRLMRITSSTADH